MWRDLTVAAAGTHHVRDGCPAYERRFRSVLKFHEPGLAPVVDDSGAYHIDHRGRPAYETRFRRTFGFYEGLAAVDGGDGWFHVDPFGRPVSRGRFDWCGNFQGGRCAVRFRDGAYGHIDTNGNPAYRTRYRYVGDYRDAVACVQDDRGLHTHIDRAGRPLHGRWFNDLDVFHKGIARARDARGWCHVDGRGEPLYARRFANVEPFYNGQARVESAEGALLVIDESGRRVVELRPPRRTDLDALSADLVGFWRTQAIHAAVKLDVFEHLPARAADLELAADGGDRLLSALRELGLVERAPGGEWMATERGNLLRRDHPLSLREAVWHWGEEMYREWEQLPEALRNGTSRRPFFDSLDKVRSRRYQRAIAPYARHDYQCVARWLPLRRHRVVLDAGGGSGDLLVDLLESAPHLEGVLLDRPQVVRALDLPCRVVGGDFFEPWPAVADAIILARVLHDWNDADAGRILARAREALSEGGRIYVLERVDAAPMLDLHMLVSTGGRERTADDFRSLFEGCGLALEGIVETRRGFAVVEASVR